MASRKPPSIEDTTQVVQLTPEQRKALREPHLLRQVSGPGAPRTFPLTGDRVTIGRSESADITVDSQQLSRTHAVLEKTAEGYTCRDLGSANGTWVEGVKVVSAVLRDDDTVQLGDVVFEYDET
jgi:pSer/pThr/pTyr-binding forkhead associated (FHA) protein